MGGLQEVDYADYVQVPSKEWRQLKEHDGRNSALFNQLRKEVAAMTSSDELVDRALTLNGAMAQPMEAEEVEGRNKRLEYAARGPQLAWPAWRVL